MSQQQVKKQTSKQQDDVDQVDAKPSVSKASDIIDDLLDAIDEVLEENAEEFVKSYKQQGGE